jgi:hypothetical protein
MCSGGTTSVTSASKPLSGASANKATAANSSDMNDSEYRQNTAWSYSAMSRRRTNISHRKGSEIGISMNENL